MKRRYKKASLWIRFKILIYGWLLYFYTENTSLKTHFAIQIWAGIINNNLSPQTCEWCYTQEFKEITRDTINYDICEFEVRCKCCDKQVGYWSYGHWEI